MSITTVDAVRLAAGTGDSSPTPAMPWDVAWTSTSWSPASAASHAAYAAPDRAASARPRSGVRLATVTRAPASTSPKTTACAAPPAPSTSTRRPSSETTSRSASTAPAASVLCPVTRPPSLTSVFTAPMREACGVTASRCGRTSTLNGIDTPSPRMPSARMPESAPRTSTHANGAYIQSSPSARYPASCIARPSETGNLDSDPQTVTPLMRPRARGTPRRRARASPPPARARRRRARPAPSAHTRRSRT